MQVNKSPGMVSGFRVCLVEYKFLWFTFYSRRKIKVYPGYFIDKNSNKIVLENAIVKSIYRPKRDTWYHIYLYYPDKKVVDIIFHDKVGYHENHRRVGAVLINNKKRVRPFKQFGDYLIWDNPSVQKIKNLTMLDDVKIITRGFKTILSHQDKIIEKLQKNKDKLCK